jgi:selenocysteine-specific elongation factor
VLLEGESLKPGQSALAQVRLERPAVAARGDRFVIRSYSPSRTVGGGSVIEPAAKKRRRAEGVESLAVRESGSLEARVLQRLESEKKPAAVATLAQALSEPEGLVADALARLEESDEAASLPSGRWLSAARWREAREAIEREVRAYSEKHPARFGVPKGELKSGLKALDSALFDAAFDSLAGEGALEVRSERVRPTGTPWQPPADISLALERVEAELESNGLSVPENAQWQKNFGAQASEVVALGTFLGRLVRVSQEFTYTARQLDQLRSKLAAHFAKQSSLPVAAFKDLAAVSRKYAVPLLEHADRVGWTIRAGDERKAGGKLGTA